MIVCEKLTCSLRVLRQILTGDTSCTPGQLPLRQIVVFATALVFQGIEGETSHSLLTLPTARMSLLDTNLSRLVLVAITNKYLIWFSFQERGHVVKAFIILTPGYQAKVSQSPEEKARLVKDIQVDVNVLLYQ